MYVSLNLLHLSLKYLTHASRYVFLGKYLIVHTQESICLYPNIIYVADIYKLKSLIHISTPTLLHSTVD